MTALSVSTPRSDRAATEPACRRLCRTVGSEMPLAQNDEMV